MQQYTVPGDHRAPIVSDDDCGFNPERIEDLMLRDNVRLGDVATVFFGSSHCEVGVLQKSL